MSVTLSKAVRSNLLHLQNTAKMMDVTQERLATGNKVNSALDNPTNFFTASSLNARAADIGTLLDSMSNGIRTIEAADNGLSAITKTIESMQSTLRQARQDKSFQVGSYELADPRTGELTLSGGGFPVGEDRAIALTNARPATLTSGVAHSLQGSQGLSTVTPAVPIVFDDDGDTIDFSINIDGTAHPVSITREMVNSITPGTPDQISDAAELAAVMELAIGTEFEADTFSVEATGGNVVVSSASRGPDSVVEITGGAATDVDGGGGTALVDGGIATAANTVAAPDEAVFTVHYGTEDVEVTINGDDHTDLASVAKAINDAITADNAGKPEAELINVTASVSDGNLVLRGQADGTGPEITVDGADADIVFGTTAQRSSVEPSEADGPAKTVDELVREINSNAEFKNIIRASNDNGKLRIENLSTSDLEITGMTDGKASGGLGTTEIGGNDVRANLAKQYNELRSELDRLAEDASFNGINLLRGDQLKIVFNELGTSMIEIETKGSDGNPRPINSDQLSLGQITEQDLDLDASIDELLGGLQLSLNEVRSQASDLGSTLSVVQNRENFTKEMINTLETGAANLTLADTNEEAANMLALQTRQQLSQTALSLASQADQAVLRLFG